MHYQELAHPIEDRDPDRIEVVELFWYGCPTCYDLLPTIQLWEASYRSADMDFHRLPVIWNAAMETHARLYLTADVLGLLLPVNKSSWEVVPSIHNTFFDAVHLRHEALRAPTDAVPLFEQWGVGREDYQDAWDSQAVATRLAQLEALPAFTELPSLPALVVHGRYLVTFNEFVTSNEDLFKVMNHLVILARKGS